MRTRIVPFLYCGMAMYEVQTRHWYWPFWTRSITTTSLREAQSIAHDIRTELIAP